jgi:uncharacterized OB-fold protein
MSQHECAWCKRGLIWTEECGFVHPGGNVYVLRCKECGRETDEIRSWCKGCGGVLIESHLALRKAS